MAQSKDIYSRTPTFHDTEAAYTLPNEYVLLNLICSFHPALIVAKLTQVDKNPVKRST